MKRNIFFIFTLLCFLSAISNTYAQVVIGSSYQTNGIHSLIESDINGKFGAPFGIDPIPIPAGTKFTVVNTSTSDKGSYVIEIWLWAVDKNTYNAVKSLIIPKDQSTLMAANSSVPLANIASQTTGVDNLDKVKCYNFYNEHGLLPQRRHFLISSDELAANATVLKPYFDPIGGAATLPFKWRFQHNANFDQNLSISGLAGLKHAWRNPDWSTSYLVGIGIASIALDSSNSTKPSSANLSAISLSFGVVIQYKTLQLGGFLGCDKISNNQTYGWKYQGNLWGGIGIGFSIFSPSTTATVAQKKNTN